MNSLNGEKRAAEVIERKIENAKSPEQKENEQWVSLKRDMDFNIGTCVEIDTGKNNYSYRPAFTNSIFGKIERLANNGKINLVLKALDYIKQIQEDEKIGLKKAFIYFPPQNMETQRSMRTGYPKERRTQ